MRILRLRGPAPSDAYYIFKSLYREYEPRTLRSLIAELSFVNGKKEEDFIEMLRKFPRFEKALNATEQIDSAQLKFYKMSQQDSIAFEKEIVAPINQWQARQE